MSNDPIVAELDRLRAEQMERYHFDFEPFYRDLKEQERLSQQPILAPEESTLERAGEFSSPLYSPSMSEQ